MLIKTKLLLLALIPVPLLLLLAAGALFNADAALEAARRDARALELIELGGQLSRRLTVERDQQARAASLSAAGSEAELSSAASPATLPGLADARDRLREFPAQMLAPGLDGGRRLLLQRLEDAAGREAPRGLLAVLQRHGPLMQSLAALPDLASASSGSAELARDLRLLSAMERLENGLALEQIFVRHALLTRGLPPHLRREFFTAEGWTEQQHGLVTQIFGDPALRQRFQDAFAEADRGGRAEALQQVRDFGLRQDLLGNLHQALGYGGLRYHYANFLLRRQAEDRSAFERQAARAEALLTQLRESGLSSAEEEADLERIGALVAGYRNAMARLVQGAPVSRTFTGLVEDVPALAALERVTAFRSRLDVAAWDGVSGALLDAVGRERSALRARLQQQVAAELVARQQALWATLLATLLTLAITAAVARPLYARMTQGIRLLVDEFERMVRSGDVLPRQVLEGRDELSQINQAVVAIGQRLDAVARAASQMAAGHLVEVPAPLSEDDRLALAMSALSASAREVVAQAEAISAGDYDTTVTPRSAQDSLALSLNHMAQALGRFRDEMRQNQWLSEGQLAVLAAMANAGGSRGLAQSVLDALSDRCGAPLGVLYLRDDSGFTALATQATAADLDIAGHLHEGEGLVGRAIQSARTQYYDSLPAGYLRLRSGLGEQDVAGVSLTPLRAGLGAVGVLEFGWLQPPPAGALALLDAVAEPVALALVASEARARTETLLEETRLQAERLREQQEELQQSNEELEQQAQMLRQSEEELKAQREELQTSNEELEEKSELLQRQREQLQRTTDELQQATRYKSEFLANMSHELRTPLNSLLILSKSLAQNEDGNLTEDQVRAAQVIHDGGRDLLSLINDILDLSKVEAGRLDIHPQTLSLRRVLEALRRQFEPVAQDKGLELVIEAAPGIEDELVSDRQRLEQILRNLLSNALKFTERGRVRLRVESEQMLQDELAVPGLSFTVEDSGIGIAPDQLELIFNAFQQGDGSTSRRYGGTGLGLAIARQLATLLGGSVRASSRVGEGSRFTLLLPQRMAYDGPLAVAEPVDTLPPRQGPVRSLGASVVDDRSGMIKGERSILVVEDDLHYAQIVRDAVRRRGYKCVVATDGGSALQLARHFMPSAIILDLRLPDMDGRRVLNVLKTSPVTRHIPVHVLSMEERSLELLSQGAVGFMQKPADIGALQAVIDQLEVTLSRAQRTVLVVENDPGSQAAISALLKNDDTCIEMVTTAAAARELLGRTRVDCIVLDLTLPDSDGIDLLEQLRRDEVQGHPPVVVYTARELSAAEHRRLSELAQSVVLKGASSSDRLLDEVLLFLHAVEEELPEMQKQAVARVHGGADALNGRKVLLVDDDLRNVFALSRLLRGQGLEVIGADNGQMALERLDEHPDVAVVLMDVMMPVMDGLEATRRIRAQARFAQLPVIAVTARAMLEDRRKCIEAGASDYLSKPVEFDALVAMLRIWIGSRA